METDGVGWVRPLGFALLLAQLGVLLALSSLMYTRSLLSFDYSIFEQARYLISHGVLDPFSTVRGIPYWQNHGEWIMWPLAWISLIYPHGYMLLVIQDVATVATEALVFSWVIDLTRRPSWPSGLPAHWAAGLCLVLLVADPWWYWSDVYDFHFQALAALFMVLIARDLENNRIQRLWIWVPLLLSIGDVAGTYVIGVGLAGFFIGNRRWRPNAALILLGVSWVLLMELIRADLGSQIGALYAYLLGPIGGTPGTLQVLEAAIHRPRVALSGLWTNRWNIWANLTGPGLIGLASPWGGAVALTVLLPAALTANSLFGRPSFQTLPIYPFMTVGTFVVLAWLCRHRFLSSRLTACLGVLLAAQTVVWGAVWLPRILPQWDLATPAAASALTAAAQSAPPSAEVVVTSGVMGDFADREYLYGLLTTPATFPVKTRTVYFVLAPTQGQELPVQYEYPAIDDVASLSGSRLVLHRAGVWEFRWTPPLGARSFTLDSSATFPAWALPTATGYAVTSGPPNTWHVEAADGAGYVVDGAYFLEPPGIYTADVNLASTGPVNVEVWNATGNVLLARREMPLTSGWTTVSMSVDARHAYQSRELYMGWGPFRYQPVSSPPGNRLEIRVWSGSGGVVDVRAVTLVSG